MTKRLGLSAMPRRTHDARLAALGAVVPQRDCFAPLWEHVQRGGKTIDHEPHHTLLEVVVSMRADCSRPPAEAYPPPARDGPCRRVGAGRMCRPGDALTPAGGLALCSRGAVADG